MRGERCTRMRRGRNRGGCSCELKGGGSLGLPQLSTSNYYPFNPMDKDPNYFSLATRSIGGSRRKKRGQKKSRRVRGGGISAGLVNALQPVVQNTVVGADMFKQTLPHSVFHVATA
jgi:hypothetical protein